MLAQLTHYTRLMRLEKPIGIFLLMWPCFWGVMLAQPPRDEIVGLLTLFAIGSVIMRSAGCIINDMVDRKMDAMVERTKNRPLASGAVSVREASILLALLLGAGLAIAASLGTAIILWSLAWMPLVIAYPFMKRITWWPQAFLGITFNAGILFGGVAVDGIPSMAAWGLYAGAIFWTIGYDSIYGFQDIEDDQKIGIKSTSQRFAAHPIRWIAGCYLLFTVSLIAAGMVSEAETAYFIIIAFAALHLLWQINLFNPNNTTLCLRLFKSNLIAGALISSAFALNFI